MGSLPSVELLVLFEVGAATEALPAVRAEIEFLGFVNRSLLSELGAITEFYPTVGTLAALLQLVGSEVGAVIKAVPTLGTLVGLLHHVQLLVLAQAVATVKGFPAVGTLVRPPFNTDTWMHTRFFGILQSAFRIIQILLPLHRAWLHF